MADNNNAVPSRAILFFASEWDTSKGGLSSFNIELATLCAQLGNQYNMRVWCAVPQFSPEQKERAEESGVTLIGAKKFLSNTPLESFISGLRFSNDCKKENVFAVVGHAHITGEAAKYFIDEHWDLPGKKPLFVFFNHITPLLTDPQKHSGNSGDKKQEQLLNLAKHADIVFSVGPRMYRHFETEYEAFDKKPVHYQYIPPLSQYFLKKFRVNRQPAEEARVLCFGRAEDERVKGFDIIARAMGEVSKVDHMTNPTLVARGIPEDELEETRDHLLKIGNTGRLTLQCLPFGSQEKIAADLMKSAVAVMPSRSEPFGLVVLEAIASGVPVLVSDRSGVADYLKSLNIGAESCIVNVSGSPMYLEEDADIWKAKIIDALNNRQGRFAFVARIREALLQQDEKNQSVKKFVELCLAQNQGQQPAPVQRVEPQVPNVVNAAQPQQVQHAPVQVVHVPQVSLKEQEEYLTATLAFDVAEKVGKPWTVVAKQCRWNNPAQLTEHLGAGYEVASLIDLLYRQKGTDGLKKFREVLEALDQTEALKIINNSICRPMFY